MALTERLRTYLLPITAALLFFFAVVSSHVYGGDQLSVAASSFASSLHAPGFAVVALLLFVFLPRRFSGSSRYFVAGAAAMTIGVLSEAAQIPGPRDAEIMDLIIDATGIFGALSVVAIFDVAIRAQLTANQRWIMALLSMLAMTATISPTLWYAYALTARHQALPSLLSFEHAWERVNISQSSHRRVELIASPKDWPTSGQRVAQVAESRRRGDLLSLHPYPNWLDYTSVSFLAASTTETTHQVRVTIRDMRPNQESHSNRFKTSILVGPQPVRYTIRLDDIRDTSVDRIFDLAHIDSIILRASNPGDDVKVLVDDFRLEL